MNASYRHPTLSERESIMILLAQGKKQSEIARQLGRSCSTISCPALANFHRHGACYRRRHLPASQRIEKVLRRWLALPYALVLSAARRLVLLFHFSDYTFAIIPKLLPNKKGFALLQSLKKPHFA